MVIFFLNKQDNISVLLLCVPKDDIAELAKGRAADDAAEGARVLVGLQKIFNFLMTRRNSSISAHISQLEKCIQI
jgi:hypothetical protein